LKIFEIIDDFFASTPDNWFYNTMRYHVNEFVESNYDFPCSYLGSRRASAWCLSHECSRCSFASGVKEFWQWFKKHGSFGCTDDWLWWDEFVVSACDVGIQRFAAAVKAAGKKEFVSIPFDIPRHEAVRVVKTARRRARISTIVKFMCLLKMLEDIKNGK